MDAGPYRRPAPRTGPAHFMATAAGTVTFSPDLTNIAQPAYNTLILGINGGISKDQIDVGSSRTLTISTNSAPTLDAIGDKTILEDAGQQALPLTGISAGGASDAGQSLTITATSSNPELIPNPTVTYGGPNTTGGLAFTPAANKSGTATITVTVKDNGGTGGGGVDTFTRTFIVTVGAVNDAPSFTKGADQEANDESGSVSVTGWATNVLAGPADEANQTLSFVVTTDNTSLFTVLPAIDATGKLTFTTAPNVDGIAQVTVVLHDNGGTDNGGHDASAAQTFAIHVAKLHPLHNEVQPLDASGDNAITAKDPLVCINYINAYGAGKVPKDPPPGTEYLDVNGDGSITAIDPLTVINYINAYGTTNTHAVSASSGGEGEDSTAADLAIAEIAPATPARPATANDLPSIIALLASDSAEQAAKRRKL